ncbi:DUF1338 domain-containing protein [Billgrantia tianxiuensis]|jgi:hypothetical protein|uniref:2-oxoadipate dioxygenase/decarboxylase n=1 Tax=Billgrantia tianxiuensis TaxID=2497861 RepID=A0A6I6SQY6_9GAMM|nr:MULTISPECIES: DUF1338 domain-containing protein [Halomonas]MCE8031666.1 DUF1338 domain-containing protein [Halomonas sp. MCCC 1A11057]QHC50200.1 DUF1338 domain-containing protein [Halomonas tianxiuensis]
MQREEFLQQLWLDYIHHHPDVGMLRLWPTDAPVEYLTLLTLDQSPFAEQDLLPTLGHLGYRPVHRYAMADRGLLVSLLAPPDDGTWLVLAELQLSSLSREPRNMLTALVSHTHPQDTRGKNLLCRGRPWAMPSWELYSLLYEAHPLAGWIAVMGPSVHHAGFDCERLGHRFDKLDAALAAAGLAGSEDRHHGVFPVSPLLQYRFYPTCSQRLAFADGDEHRIGLGGLALMQKRLSSDHERAVELLLPHHTRCEIT